MLSERVKLEQNHTVKVYILVWTCFLLACPGRSGEVSEVAD